MVVIDFQWNFNDFQFTAFFRGVYHPGAQHFCIFSQVIYVYVAGSFVYNMNLVGGAPNIVNYYILRTAPQKAL